MKGLDPIPTFDSLVPAIRADQDEESARYAAITPEEFAQKYGRACYWRILVQPLPPATKIGRFITAEQTQKNEEYLTTIGRIIAVGRSAFKGATASGIKLDNEDIKVGDWIMYGKYIGQVVLLATGQRLIALDDSDIILHIKDPAGFRNF